MSNTQLLTKEELRDKLWHAVSAIINEPASAYTSNRERIMSNVAMLEEIIDSQKIAHGNMVIGDYTGNDLVLRSNQAEQRKRNV